MASLTQVSIVARKTIRFSVYFLILLIFTRFLIKTGINIYKRLFPEPPPAPTVTFGKLPKIPFPEQKIPKDISYRLETPEGELPVFIEQLPVYYMPPVNMGIKGLDNAKQIAKNLEFDSKGVLIDNNIPNIYTFNKRGTPSVLTINITNQTFSISYNMEADPQILNNTPPLPEEALKLTKSFLSSANLLTEDLTGPVKTQFIRSESGKLKEVISLSESDFIQVNLFRKNVKFREMEFPSLTPKYPNANVWLILIGGELRSRTVIAGEYHYFPIDEEKMGTYPIKTSQKAWDELQKGNAFIVRNNENQKEVVIRRIYLAYYDAGYYTQFYQPIVVFEGDDNFIAYVPAVAEEYYGVEENKKDNNQNIQK